MIKTGTKYKIFCGPGMFLGQVFSSATRGLWYFSFSVVKGGYNEPSTEHNGKTETPSWFYQEMLTLIFPAKQFIELAPDGVLR